LALPTVFVDHFAIQFLLIFYQF